LTLQGPASTIVNMDSTGDPPLPLAAFRGQELTKAHVACDKHPEAGQ
jgi:hypothetical protein